MTVRLRYAAKSDVGLLREGNEDSAYAGPRLLAVADGMGGHAHGEVASACAIATLAPLDGGQVGSDMRAALENAVREANSKLRRMVEGDTALEGMGTTLTAMLWTQQQLALVHIGDSRGYLLRDGELYRITHDHTLVQSLIDDGRIDEEEAAVHPQRSLILRALDGRSEVEPDLTLHEVRLGDRYLLCSDGLSGVVSEDTLRETLHAGWDPDRVVQQLIELANRGGGPDNVTCVVADVVDAAEEGSAPLIAGAAANTVDQERTEDTITMDTSAGRAAALMRQSPDTSPAAESFFSGAEPAPPRRWPKVLVSLVVLVVAVGGAAYAVTSYARSQYYVGARDGEVVIFRGISQQVIGQRLSRVHARTGLTVGELPTYERAVVTDDIHAETLRDAEAVVQRLRAEVQACLRQQQQRRKEQKQQERQEQKQQRENKPERKKKDGQGQPNQKPETASTSVPAAPATSPGPTGPADPPKEAPPRGCVEEVSATGG